MPQNATPLEDGELSVKHDQFLMFLVFMICVLVSFFIEKEEIISFAFLN